MLQLERFKRLISPCVLQELINLLWLRSVFNRANHSAHCIVTICIISVYSSAVYSEIFPLPPAHVDLIGNLQKTQVKQSESLLEIARQFDLGRTEIEIANPSVDLWLPKPEQDVLLPTQFLLPRSPREGIVLNLPEMRLYHFRRENVGLPDSIATHPVSIGQHEWRTPLGATEVVKKRKNPVWIPPESIKLEAEQEGRPLPDIVPAGPSNPLGDYALNLAIPSYLLHGTNRPLGIGMRVTHGCVRLYPEDIQSLYYATAVGTPVTIVNQPVKLGWSESDLYIEVHPPLREFHMSDGLLLEIAAALLRRELQTRTVKVQSSLLRQVVARKDGVPVRLSGRSWF